MKKNKKAQRAKSTHAEISILGKLILLITPRNRVFLQARWALIQSSKEKIQMYRIFIAALSAILFSSTAFASGDVANYLCSGPYTKRNTLELTTD